MTAKAFLQANDKIYIFGCAVGDRLRNMRGGRRPCRPRGDMCAPDGGNLGAFASQ